jgi:hypothetical protein
MDISYIGFSYSRCVRDIIEDKIQQEQVLRIISRTSCLTIEDFDLLIEELSSSSYGYYRRTFNGLDVEKIKFITRNLWYRGAIIQPRLLQLPDVFSFAPSYQHHWQPVMPSPQEITDDPVLLSTWNDFMTYYALKYPELNKHVVMYNNDIRKQMK